MAGVRRISQADVVRPCRFSYIRVCKKTSLRQNELGGEIVAAKGRHLGEFEELVLLSVRWLREQATVLAIKELMARVAERDASLGAIYAALDRAERKGLSESSLGDAEARAGGRPKRFYRLTEAGEEALAHSRGVRETFWSSAGEAAS